MNVYLAVKVRELRITFWEKRWRANQRGAVEITESDLPKKQPILNFRGIRLWIVSE
jgi:hypothetical protein